MSLILCMEKRRNKFKGPFRFTKSIPKSKSLVNRLYTVSEMIRLTGMTRRQAMYWAKIGLLSPKIRNLNAAGSQPALFYSESEVMKALIVVDMLKRGISLRQVRQVVHYLEKLGARLDQSKEYFLTNGHTVYYARDNDEVIDILKHKGQMLLIPIHDYLEKIRKVA